MILNPGTARCPAVCYAEGRAASDANRGQAPRACHALVPARAAAGASGTVTRTVW